MKFGHEYKDFLQHGGFPADWVTSAISYQQLKKCIKRVKLELASLGLDAEILQQLIGRAESVGEDGQSDNKGLRYEFERDGRELGCSQSKDGEIVRPKLLFFIDEATGEPVDARLAPETKRYLYDIALSERFTNVQLAQNADAHSPTSNDSSAGSSRRPSKAGHKVVEIPLTSDSQFFEMLQTEISGLATLQHSEKKKIESEIVDIGDKLVKGIDHNSKSGRADLEHWRRIFELYMDSRIFFNVGERNHGAQLFTAAQDRYNKFLDQANKAQLLKKFKQKENMGALQHFLRINVELLQHLRFQEINQTAMVKILKSELTPMLLHSSRKTSILTKQTTKNSINVPRSTQNQHSQPAPP